MKIRKMLRQEGLVHGSSYSTSQQRKVNNGRAPKQDAVDICLNCTKEHCSGTTKCFKKEKLKSEK